MLESAKLYPKNLNFFSLLNGVDDGARTHDTRYHKPALYQLRYIHHSGLPGRIRTCDPLLRRQMLYPAELPGDGDYSIEKELISLLA